MTVVIYPGGSDLCQVYSARSITEKAFKGRCHFTFQSISDVKAMGKFSFIRNFVSFCFGVEAEVAPFFRFAENAHGNMRIVRDVARVFCCLFGFPEYVHILVKTEVETHHPWPARCGYR